MPKILIVDDEWLTRLEIEGMLTDLGYDVAGQAETGAEGIAKARELNPDLILMDVKMPGEMNGIDAAREIKRELGTPIVFISGYGDPEYIEAAKEIAPFGYVMKPFDEREIHAFVEIALSKRKLELKLEESHERLEQTNLYLRKEIEARKNTEMALQESEDKYRTLFDTSPHAIALTEVKTGKLIDVNDKFCKISKYTRDELIDRTTTQLGFYSEDNRNRFVNELTNSGKVHNLEMEFEIKDGSIINTRMFAISIQIKGKVLILSEFYDITEQKGLEAKLQETQKMEAIGTLAGGIAHEFNNALMGIMGNIELLKIDFSEDGGIDKHLEPMKSAGHRMSHLTAQLLAYAEGGKYQPKDLKLNDFVIETLPILQHNLSPTVRVETVFPKDISHIEADHAQMQMVLSAILANSNEAIEDEGIIRITTENKDLDENFTKQHPGLEPGYYVSLTIEDDGRGMDEETKRGIFEPFFTTKFQGRGMGMAAVYGVVMNHDGGISVDSELGKGTTVRIYLPAIEIEVEKPKKGAKAGVSTGSGTILMIEDEDVVIEVTQAMLEMLGYRVMVAKTGKDAIHIAETFDGQVDLALLDIKLPDINGRNLYPLIMKARPDLKVVVFSGYSIDGPAREILDAGAQDFIQKPFSIATLSEKLKGVLEGK